MTILPQKLEVPPAKILVGAAARYLRVLQGKTYENVGNILTVVPSTVKRREFEGYGLDSLEDIQEHFSALGYDVHITFTRKAQS